MQTTAFCSKVDDQEVSGDKAIEEAAFILERINSELAGSL
jgi:hypothetical protein